MSTSFSCAIPEVISCHSVITAFKYRTVIWALFSSCWYFMWCQRPNTYNCTVPAHWEIQQNHAYTFILLTDNRAALFHHHRNSIYHNSLGFRHRFFHETSKNTYRILPCNCCRCSLHTHKHWKWEPIHDNRFSWHTTSSSKQCIAAVWEAGSSCWHSSRTSVRQSGCKEVLPSLLWHWFFGDRNLEG